MFLVASRTKSSEQQFREQKTKMSRTTDESDLCLLSILRCLDNHILSSRQPSLHGLGSSFRLLQEWKPGETPHECCSSLSLLGRLDNPLILSHGLTGLLHYSRQIQTHRKIIVRYNLKILVQESNHDSPTPTLGRTEFRQHNSLISGDNPETRAQVGLANVTPRLSDRAEQGCQHVFLAPKSRP